MTTMSKDNPLSPVQVEVHRLSLQMYQKLEKELPNPAISDSTSELSAGVKLGVQLVLQKLREGYVLGA